MCYSRHMWVVAPPIQENIGIEVAGKLTKYSDNGSAMSAVNFPEVSLPMHKGTSRLLHSNTVVQAC